MFEREYQLEFFKENGYTRKTCVRCKTPFWTLSDTDICGDSPCVEYGFINNSPVKNGLKISAVRNKFLRYFESKKHTIVKRYPVIARWRKDVFLVNASIYDFQPLVTSGKAQPPANPLVVSQPCIRLNDIDLVGKTSKYLTIFEMMGHHAFNTKSKYIYWKEETVKYCNDFFTKVILIPKEEIIYKEHPWIGGGNAGPSLEVIVRGLEIATLVFMNLKEDSNGNIILDNTRYAPLDINVVDTGYGLERISWLTLGMPTIYDATHHDFVDSLCSRYDIFYDIDDDKFVTIAGEFSRFCSIAEKDIFSSPDRIVRGVKKKLAEKGIHIDEKKITDIIIPLQNVYTIADHTKCLAFMLGDGIVPSNVKSGYLARLVIRRLLRILEDMNIDISLDELVREYVDYLGEFPELKRNIETIEKILSIETQRYIETTKKGVNIVKRILKKNKGIPLDKLIELYDSYGIHPTIVQKVSKDIGIDVKVPDDINAILAEKHAKIERETTKEEEKKIDHPETKLLYYEDAYIKEFDAVVLQSKGNEIILDRTAFYPEGGGQPCDIGTITTEDKTYNVLDVQKIGNVVVHKIDGNIKVGTIVHGKIDWEHRIKLMRHHTATHIILSALRKVLGNHVWQTGAQKGTEFSRVDITHYEKITDEQLREVELIANDAVMSSLPVEKIWIDRTEAEKKYGFGLYQGGVPPGNSIRVVRILDLDVEACGGTHLRNTSEVGPIKILRTEKIQDGVQRVEFAAGMPAVKKIQDMEKKINKVGEILNALPSQIPETAEKIFNQWKKLRKDIHRLYEKIGCVKLSELLTNAEKIKNIRVVTDMSIDDNDELLVIGKKVAREYDDVVAILCNRNTGNILIARSKDVNINCVEILREMVKIVGGKGGGKPDFATGNGQLKGNMSEAMKYAKSLIKEKLSG